MADSPSNPDANRARMRPKQRKRQEQSTGVAIVVTD
jgi:hypothetical protein